MIYNSRGLKPALQSILLKTSLATDLKYSGSELTITGAKRKIAVNRIVSIKRERYRAEVVQVVTCASNSYTPQASTRYSVLIGDPTRVNAGGNEALLPYSYTTPSDLTTLGATAALQREAIHGEIVAAINANPNNYVVAATLGTGSGFTVTDDAGYYPAHGSSSNNRNGKSVVVANGNSDGSGFTSAQVNVTTEAVYSFGVGANLLAWAPVSNAMTGNLTSGGFLAPVAVDGTFAVSGQNYDCFRIETLETQSAHNVTGQLALVSYETLIFVDNGTGTATTNLTGFIAFNRAFKRLLAKWYSVSPNTIGEFFDNNFTIQGQLGAVPVTTANLKNKFLTPYGTMLNHTNIGTQTIVAPTQGATGLLIEQDATATEGAHYSAEVVTACPKEFVVGKDEVTVLFQASATTVANIVIMAGLRTKEAYAADFNDYTNLAAAGTGPSGTDFYTYGILANAATVATDTTANAANSTIFSIQVVVDIAGLVSIYVNGTKYPVYSAGTTPLSFAAGTVLIPFFQYTNLNSAAAVPVVYELLALPSAQVVI